MATQPSRFVPSRMELMPTPESSYTRKLMPTIMDQTRNVIACGLILFL